MHYNLAVMVSFNPMNHISPLKSLIKIRTASCLTFLFLNRTVACQSIGFSICHAAMKRNCTQMKARGDDLSTESPEETGYNQNQMANIFASVLSAVPSFIRKGYFQTQRLNTT